MANIEWAVCLIHPRKILYIIIYNHMVDLYTIAMAIIQDIGANLARTLSEKFLDHYSY